MLIIIPTLAATCFSALFPLVVVVGGEVVDKPVN